MVGFGGCDINRVLLIEVIVIILVDDRFVGKELPIFVVAEVILEGVTSSISILLSVRAVEETTVGLWLLRLRGCGVRLLMV